MATSLPSSMLKYKYFHAAQDYLRSVSLEHVTEATAQGTQRKITLASLELVHARRPEVQVFNELLVQYPLPDDAIGQIVPDNMVVVWKEPIEADGSFDVPFQPARPFWVLEYVSKHNQRKDYEISFSKYEQDLQVPFYLTFYPDAQEMNLFRLSKKKYVSVKPNRHGRLAIPKLDLELALLDEWVRFWYQGELLPLPGDLLEQLDEAKRQLLETQRQLQIERDEVTRLRAELERLQRKK